MNSACNFVLSCTIQKALCFSIGKQTSSSKLLLSINSWSVWLSREKIRLGLRFETHYICEKSCRKRTSKFIHITTKTNQGNNISCHTSFIIQLIAMGHLALRGFLTFGCIAFLQLVTNCSSEYPITCQPRNYNYLSTIAIFHLSAHFSFQLWSRFMIITSIIQFQKYHRNVVD